MTKEQETAAKALIVSSLQELADKCGKNGVPIGFFVQSLMAISTLMLFEGMKDHGAAMIVIEHYIEKAKKQFPEK